MGRLAWRGYSPYTKREQNTVFEQMDDAAEQIAEEEMKSKAVKLLGKTKGSRHKDLSEYREARSETYPANIRHFFTTDFAYLNVGPSSDALYATAIKILVVVLLSLSAFRHLKPNATLVARYTPLAGATLAPFAFSVIGTALVARLEGSLLDNAAHDEREELPAALEYMERQTAESAANIELVDVGKPVLETKSLSRWYKPENEFATHL